MHDVDELFVIPAPAALMRCSLGHSPDTVRQSRTHHRGGVNAGTVVLKPNAAEFESRHDTLRCEADATLERQKALKHSTRPEQDFYTH